MSTQIVAVIINLLSVILPYLGIDVGSEQLTETIQTIIAVATGIWIWYQRTRLQEAPLGKGDVNLGGFKRN